MREPDNQRQREPILQRVRCGHCRMPLVQVHQGQIPYTLQRGKEEAMTTPLSAYSYRTLTDPTLLLSCPTCGAVLSPTAVTAVQSLSLVTEEKEK